ncbi:MAG: coenzyme F420-0:L-glutamate ligase [Actinomycetota bacterium]|nr:coenzyme F420-0:L-glutamate ligase [Actinomycetota bacterium]
MSTVNLALTCLPVTGIGEIGAGDDVAALIQGAHPLAEGDVLVVTSKVVSKAEGRVVASGKEAVLADETDRVVARRGGTWIVRTHHGLVLAAAGIDASNTELGTLVLLPVDPDGSAREIRARIARDGKGPNVAVVVTDTLGRAWRHGQTDVAIGAAGIEVLHDYAGTPDGYGNQLAVTAPAVADEIAGAADLVKGKLDRSPAAVLRGLGNLVLPRGVHGPGARELVRGEGSDMFGFGAREAVLAAVQSDPRDLRGFGTAASSVDLVAVLRAICPSAAVVVSEGGQGPTTASVEVHLTAGSGEDAQRSLGGNEARVTFVAFSMGWTCQEPTDPVSGTDVALRFCASTP